MIRQTIEDYLDDAMTPAERAAVEHAVAIDPQASQLVARMRRERALRAAVLAQYEPPADEARAFALRVLAACADEAAAPVGHVGVWLRRGLGIAAALALVIAGFAAGRLSAVSPGQSEAPVASAQPVEIIRVLYNDDAGEQQMKEFASLEEANGFMKEMSARHADPVVVASGFDTDHPGAF